MKYIALFLPFVLPVLAGAYVNPPDLKFTITSTNPTPIGRTETYDSHPSAIREDNGNIQVWYCGGGLNTGTDPYFTHDSVFYVELNPQGQVIDGPMRVLAPGIGSQAPIAGDGWHACAPSVIKHRHPDIDPDFGGPAVTGAEHYLMYYECARPAWFNDCDLVPVDQQAGCRSFYQPYFAQICMAASLDGKNWMKYNSSLNTTPPWSNSSLATAVIPISQPVSSNCHYQFDTVNQRDTVAGNQCPLASSCTIYNQCFDYTNCTDCRDNARNYGSGMPSAIVRDCDGPNNNTCEQIWLWYYDSGGGFPPFGVGWQLKLARSWDGFHFDTPVTMTSVNGGNMVNAFEIKYLNIPFNGRPAMYLGTNDPWGNNYFAYSYDNPTWLSNPVWTWANISSQANIPQWDELKIGLVNPRMCGSPGVNALVADKHGILNSVDVAFLSGEGFYSPLEGVSTPQGCENQPESNLETQSRGSTWDLFFLTGRFSSFFDQNADGMIGLADLNILKPLIGNRYSIFVYNKLVTNFGQR